MFWWLMKKKIDWELVEWADILQRSLSAQANVCVFVCVCQMPTLTEENSQFLQSGSQEVQCNAVPTWVCVYTDWALSGTKI